MALSPGVSDRGLSLDKSLTLLSGTVGWCSKPATHFSTPFLGYPCTSLLTSLGLLSSAAGWNSVSLQGLCPVWRGPEQGVQ